MVNLILGLVGLAPVGALVLLGLVASGWLVASEWRSRLRVDEAAAAP